MPQKTKKQLSKKVKSLTKICKVCKRPFDNRKRWASRGQWASVKYCSEACRKSKSK
ncbi:MAG: DUF2256 domain-containing protein [Candidatus Saccharibacteria bacterium]|nr:DUF2256 domain-containing protein [Patescibacteria group bacterium]